MDRRMTGTERSSSNLQVGIAAEHLVVADLLLSGYRAFRTDQHTPYDVAVEVNNRLYRVSVRSTRGMKPTPQRKTEIPAYMFQIRRGGKGGARLYGTDEYDLVALVALDSRLIAYVPPSVQKQALYFRPPGSPTGRRMDEFPFLSALQEVQHG